MPSVESEPIGWVDNRLGNRLYFDPRDERGVRLGQQSGDVNPDSLRLWNVALGLSKWDVVVDVGANYGEMIVGAELPKKAELVAFEPSRSVLPYLERTLADFEKPVELIRSAVADRSAAHASFARDLTWSGKSSLTLQEDDTVGDEIAIDSVSTTTLTAALADRGHRSACIKVDVEGGEDAVLEGALDLLVGLEQWAIMIEILHMSRRQVVSLAGEFNLFLLDRRVGHLIGLHSRSPRVVSSLLESGWLHAQDALLLSAPKLAERS